MYAVIAVNRRVNNRFHYDIPPDLISVLAIGHLVEVEFGTALMYGIVIGFDAESPVEATKVIRRLADPTPVITPLQIELAEWIAHHTLSPIGAALWMMLPPGLTSESTSQYTLLQPDAELRTESQRRIVNQLFKFGSMTTRQLKNVFPEMNWASTMPSLVKREIVEKKVIFNPPNARPRLMRQVVLTIPPDAIDGIAMHLGRDARRANVVEVLLAAPDHALDEKTLREFAGCGPMVIKTLESLNIITVEDKIARLVLNTDEAHHYMLETKGAQPYLDALHYLAANNGQAWMTQLIQDTGVSRDQILRLADDGFVRIESDEYIRDPIADFDVLPDVPPTLTDDQQSAWNTIREHIDAAHWENADAKSKQSHVFVLYGVTGSGKTEVYLRAVERVVSQGRQAIVLVPEIALTAQVVRRFMARFPQRVALVHSGLSTGERYDTWRRARNGEFDVVVGPRSALFTPLADLGLIIMDEEHDDSYKNAPISYTPPYHTRDLAIEMMRLNSGTLVLGSATPAVETMYRAQQGDYQMVRLSQRVLAQRDRIKRQIEYLHLADARYMPTEATEAVAIELPPVEVVDMREELKRGNRSIFSVRLQEELLKVLDAEQQAILFLNRRGTATFVMCRDCGYVANCTRCDTPLTYHSNNDQALICHHCGHREPLIYECPSCGSLRIRHFGAGTEMVHKTLNELFPQARVVRWDQDTAKARDAHTTILERFLNREADILVGTQMIAKGLDIPLVTLVGVISGDTSLGFPDFRAGERTFQMLTQVAGRAGRGLLGGRVILQTYKPDNYAVAASVTHDYDGFYEQEIAFRKQLRYPPYTRLVRITFQHRQLNKVMKLANTMASLLRRRIEESSYFSASEVIGPTPCFYTRIDEHFRWQVMVRTQSPVELLSGIDIPNEGLLDIDPVDLL